MSQGRSLRGLRPWVLVAVVLIALWRPLFAGGSLVADDQLWLGDPFNANPPAGLTVEVAEPDSIGVHSAWVRWADDLRDGEGSWWQSAGEGRPFMADGLPVTHLAYLAVPAWYAPGLVAALAMVIASFGAMRLCDRRGFTPLAGLFAGVAYGCSGLMFVWLGWPHATAIALAPWVLSGALDTAEKPGGRSALALAVPLALQLWAGVFAIAAYTVLGAVAGALATRPRRWAPTALSLVGASVMGFGLAAPHLWPRWERWSWADTSAIDAIGDTSAPLTALVTLPFGSALGNVSVDVPWVVGETQQLAVGFVGISTVLVALIGLRLGARSHAPLVLAILGVGIAYVGGPFESLSDLVAGPAAEMTHARVLLVLAVTLAAAEGIDAVVRGGIPREAFRSAWRGDRRTLGVTAAGSLVAAVLLVRWGQAVVDGNAIKAVGAASLTGLAVGGLAAGGLWSWWRGRLSGVGVAAGFVALAAFELLSFGMPIPTVISPSERIEATPAHDALDAVLGPFDRVAGDHDVFAPIAATRFGIADVRAPGLRSVGEVQAFVDVDPTSVLGAVGGSAFAPVIQVPSPDVDPSRHATWELLGVDAWVLPFDATPPGPRQDPVVDERSPLAAASPLGTITIPDHGLRAVLIDLRTPAFSTARLEIAVDGRIIEREVVLRRAVDGVIGIAVLGEDLPATATANVLLTIDSRDEPAEVGTSGGSLALGTVGGEPDRQLVGVDGALILHQPTDRAVWSASDDDASVTVVEREGHVLASVDSDAGGTLRFDIVDEPGWEVRVDGVPVAPTLVADTVIAVELKPGRHEVDVRYSPPHLWTSLLVAGVAALAGVAWAGRRPEWPSPEG